MVNVKFYKYTKIEIPENIIKELFESQRELIFKYQQVENLGELTPKGYLTSLQTKASQKVLKDFAWRVTEEVTEMFHSIYEQDDPEHPKEEIADTMHFYVELLILSGLDYDKFEMYNVKENWVPVKYRENVLELESMRFINLLGDAMNILKNKPWKLSEVPSDEDEYIRRLKRTFPAFLRLVEAYNFTQQKDFGIEELYIYYTKKHMVNHFRVDTKY